MCEEGFQFCGFPSAQSVTAMLDITTLLVEVKVFISKFIFLHTSDDLARTSTIRSWFRFQMRIGQTTGSSERRLRLAGWRNTPDVKTHGFFFVCANQTIVSGNVSFGGSYYVWWRLLPGWWLLRVLAMAI